MDGGRESERCMRREREREREIEAERERERENDRDRETETERQKGTTSIIEINAQASKESSPPMYHSSEAEAR